MCFLFCFSDSNSRTQFLQTHTRTFTEVQTWCIVNQRRFKGENVFDAFCVLKTCKKKTIYRNIHTHTHTHTRHTHTHPHAAIPTAYFHGHLINHGCFCDSPPRLMFLCRVGHRGSLSRPLPPCLLLLPSTQVQVFVCVCPFHTTSFPQSGADRLDEVKVTGIESRDYLEQ